MSSTGIRKIMQHTLIATVIVLAVAIVSYIVGQRGLLPFQIRIDEKATLSLLRTEALAFLVTHRSATQIVVEYDEADWLGEWHGVLWATVSWRWGVDLKKLTEKDIRRQGETIFVHLGEPELLDFAIDPGSVGFLSKSTAMPKVMDFFRGGWQRKILEQRLRERAMAFARDQKLCPDRRQMVDQLNVATEAFRAAAKLELRFE